MMNPIQGAVRAVTSTANAATAAAGAIGGAAVNGVIGGVQGTAQGVRNGVVNGSHSTPAAALTFVALGVTGLVEWPVLLTVGGAAILVRQLTRRSSEGSDGSNGQVVRLAAAAPTSSAAPKRAPAKKTSAKRTAARKATSRRASSSRQA